MNLLILLKNKLSIFKINIKFILILLFITNLFILYSSDRSDAAALLKKSEAESKLLEIAVKNFGDKNDLEKYDKGIKLIKFGKIKLAQSKYLDSISKLNEYLKVQYNIYKSLADKYIERTDKIIDEIAEDLVDFVDEGEVLKYFESATNYLNNAKLYKAKKDYIKVINTSRVSKKYVIGIYKLVGKEIPEQNKKDFKDINKEIDIDSSSGE